MRAKKLLSSRQIFRYAVPARTVTKKHWINGTRLIYLNPQLSNYYFRFSKTNGRHIGTLLSFYNLTTYLRHFDMLLLLIVYQVSSTCDDSRQSY